MKFIRLYILAFLCLYGCEASPKKEIMPSKSTQIIIAHRGASGYLPEHTLASKAMSYAMAPDFIEQDLVLSKDDVPMVIHDIHLEAVTNVAQQFPKRKREDGRYYVIDFTYAELKLLQVSERFDPQTGKAIYKNRFPIGRSTFTLHSLQEEIELIQGLNKSTVDNIGVYPEIKDPEFHHKEGKDISKIVLKILSDYGYTTKEDLCILQCFDAKELRRIREELKSGLLLVQLITSESTQEELKEFANYADGVGPWYQKISPDFVKSAHHLNLKVHAYTFRADDLGKFESFDSLLNHGFNTLELDGIFTDFPDKARTFLKN